MSLEVATAMMDALHIWRNLHFPETQDKANEYIKSLSKERTFGVVSALAAFLDTICEENDISFQDSYGAMEQRVLNGLE